MGPFLQGLGQSLVINKIFYSMGGCVSDEKSEPSQIIISLKKLKHQIEAISAKLKAGGTERQKILVAEFKKPKSFRAAAAEMAMASDITMKINKIKILNVVKCHVQKIDDYSHHIDKQTSATQSLYPSFRVILYSQSILRELPIDNFCRSLRKRYPALEEATDAEVGSELMIHHKRSELPAPDMVNSYLLSLVNQEGLDLNVVNSVGHAIKF